MRALNRHSPQGLGANVAGLPLSMIVIAAALVALLLCAAAPAAAAPVITLISPASSVTNDPNATIAARVGPANSTLFLDGAPLAVDGTGYGEANVTLTEGPNAFNLTSVDWQNESTSLVVYLALDTVAPLLVVTSPSEEGSLTNQGSISVAGSVDAPCTVSVNGVLTPLDAGNAFSLDVPLSDGLNVLRITATDTAGNQVVVVRTVTFDRYPPFLQVDAPISGLLTNQTTVDVTGRTERDATLTVNGLPASVDPIDGSFALPAVQLDDLFAVTENLLVIRAVDAAGNVAFANRTVLVDTRAPSIDLEFDPGTAFAIETGLPLAITTIEVRGLTDSDDATISIAGQEVALSGLSFTRTIVLSEGTNHIEISSRDAAGNGRFLTLVVIRDTVAPEVFLEEPAADVITNQSTITVIGYADAADAQVRVNYVDERGVPQVDAAPTVAVGDPVRYRFEDTIVLTCDANPHSVDVRPTDAAGNSGLAAFEYNCNVSVPDLQIIGFRERTEDTSVWINGTTSPGIDKVTINGQEFDVVAQFFSVRWNLLISSGEFEFVITIQDAWGNTNTWRGRVEVNTFGALPADLHIEGPGANSTRVAAGTPVTFRLASNGTLPPGPTIDWQVNGQYVGTGQEFTTTLGRGPHTIKAVVSTGSDFREVTFFVVAEGGADPSPGVGSWLLVGVYAAVVVAAGVGFVLWSRRRAK